MPTIIFARNDQPQQLLASRRSGRSHGWHILESDIELTLANSVEVRNVPGRKSDVSDAVWLADLLAHALIRGSFVPPRPIQQLRHLTRTRKQLTRQVAQAALRIEKVRSGATGAWGSA